MDAKLPAVIEDLGNGTAQVYLEPELVYWRFPGIRVYGPNEVPLRAVGPELTWEMLDEFAAEDPNTYRLWIDGMDRTDDLRRCHEPTGYVEPEQPLPDPALIDRQNRKIADSTNAWIACARDHGLPDLEDIMPEPDPEMGVPVVLLPLSMDEPFFAELLAACPPVNPDWPSWLATAPPEEAENPPFNPFIAIESPPGGLGDGRAESTEEGRRCVALRKLLDDAVTAAEQSAQPD
ncbi:MAG: hypothetical protein LBJ08_02305 [Bifidobacteriaceae bacterium]|jgi:hypothetical protein|nr:hypothetical protein [Bifidobacteriaceae bacterium]